MSLPSPTKPIIGGGNSRSILSPSTLVRELQDDYHRSRSRSPRPYPVSDPLSTPSSPPTPSPAPYETPSKPVMTLRSPFNTSPRFLRGYFREAQLFKDSARKIGQQLHSRFQPVVPEGFGPSLIPLA